MKICLQLKVNDEQYFLQPREETYRKLSLLLILGPVQFLPLPLSILLSTKKKMLGNTRGRKWRTPRFSRKKNSSAIIIVIKIYGIVMVYVIVQEYTKEILVVLFEQNKRISYLSFNIPFE